MRDIARERLQEIRKLQGWREAYKAGGFVDDGSPATRRRRLSRAINRKSSGGSYKKLDAKQRRKINRTYKTKTRQKAFSKGRSNLQIKAINKDRALTRKRAKATFGVKGTNPDPKKLATRLRQNKNLDDEEMKRIKKAFENIGKEEGAIVRAEYKTFMSQVKITSLPPRQRGDFRRRLDKAKKAVKRDEEKASKGVLYPKYKKKWLESKSSLTLDDWLRRKHKRTRSKQSFDDWKRNKTAAWL